jgi:hypothetical protein
VKNAERLYESRPSGTDNLPAGSSLYGLDPRLKEISQWASKKGILMPNKGQDGNIRIRGKNKYQVVLFRQEDGQVYLVMKERSYAGGASERDALGDELKTLGLYPQNLDPYKIPDGKKLTKQLHQLSEEEFKKLLEILNSHC